MSGHKPSNSQHQGSWTSRLYCILYFPASLKISGNTHPMAEQHILEYLILLISNSFGKRQLRVCTSFRFQPKFPTCITYIKHFKSEWNVFWYNWYIYQFAVPPFHTDILFKTWFITQSGQAIWARQPEGNIIY